MHLIFVICVIYARGRCAKPRVLWAVCAKPRVLWAVCAKPRVLCFFFLVFWFFFSFFGGACLAKSSLVLHLGGLCSAKSTLVPFFFGLFFSGVAFFFWGGAC